MLKLKITKPKTIKVKYNTHFPDIILANLQEKEVEPTTETQIIEADYGYDGLKRVEINPIPSEYIKPTGTKEIIENGIHNVKEFENVDVNVSYTPNYQEKNVIPTKNEQEIIADNEYDALEKVIVKPIPDEYIIPNGELQIIENGNYNVVDKESVDVNVQPILGTKTITENGIYNAIDDNLDGYSSVEVETSGVDINEYISVTPTEYRSYSGVGGWITTIKKLNAFEISGRTSLQYLYCFFQGKEIDTSKINTTGVNNMSYMFSACTYLEKVDLSNFDTSSVTNINNMFYNANSIKSVGPGEEYDINIKNFDTSNVANMNSLFNFCTQLTTVNLSNFDTSKVTEMPSIFFGDTRLTNVDLSGFNTSNVISINSMFRGASSLVNLDISNFDLGKAYTLSYAFMDCSALENLIFARNVGKGFASRTTANYYSCTLDLSNCRKLTHDSLMSVINNLYDLNLTYDVANGGTLYTQQLVLGTTNLAKLTTNEINIAVSKGWSVS